MLCLSCELPDVQKKLCSYFCVCSDQVLLYPYRKNIVSLYVCAADEKMYSMIVHTTVPFGLDNINCDVNSVCYNVILSRLRQLLPQLPTSLSVEPLRWQYSQVCGICDHHCGHLKFKIVKNVII